MSNKEYPIVENAESFEAALARVREAQRIFATYTQEQVDKIFLAAATAANKARLPLAKMAVEETGMGVAEDKVIKNHMMRFHLQSYRIPGCQPAHCRPNGLLHGLHHRLLLLQRGFPGNLMHRYLFSARP